MAAYWRLLFSVAWWWLGACAAGSAAEATGGGGDDFTITPLDAAFNAWFRDITKEFGANVNQVEIRTTNAMGRGVYALKTVKGEAPLLKIPRDYIVCVETVLGSESALFALYS